MEAMRFGKYRGAPVSQVPIDYLKWCYDQMTNCPSYVTEELGRRGVMTADVWLTRHSQKVIAKKNKAIQRSAKREARKADFAAHQRRVAQEKMAEMQAGVTIVGSGYERLRQDCDRMDCDPDECPFDTDDHKYSGPTMAFMGGKFVMVPSEFPREVQ
jgi:hypothetical protein